MNFEIKPHVFSFEPFALAVRRNDADFRLVADRVISDLYRSKKYLKFTTTGLHVYPTKAAHIRCNDPT